MQLYWILYDDDCGNFTIHHEFYEDDDVMANAYYRGKVSSYDRSYYKLVKVL